MNVEHFKNLKDIIVDSQKCGLLFEARDLSGFSGERLIGLLQRLGKYQYDTGAGCYLEIGVFQGLTLISVASVLDGRAAYGIDNFSLFDPQKINEEIIKKRAQVNNLDNVCLINADYEDTLIKLEEHIGEQKVGTYFIDGPHDYRSQFLCLELVKPYLSEFSVIVIDDCNYRHVRQANNDFLITNPNFKLLFEAYTECHPSNMNIQQKNLAKKGWWNGVNVIVYDPNGLLEVNYPETIRDRILYENEHFIHSAMCGELAPLAISFIHDVISLRLFCAFKKFLKMLKNAKIINKVQEKEFLSMNTYSKQLSSYKLNSGPVQKNQVM